MLDPIPTLQTRYALQTRLYKSIPTRQSVYANPFSQRHRNPHQHWPNHKHEPKLELLHIHTPPPRTRRALPLIRYPTPRCRPRRRWDPRRRRRSESVACARCASHGPSGRRSRGRRHRPKPRSRSNPSLSSGSGPTLRRQRHNAAPRTCTRDRSRRRIRRYNCKISRIDHCIDRLAGRKPERAVCASTTTQPRERDSASSTRQHIVSAVFNVRLGRISHLDEMRSRFGWSDARCKMLFDTAIPPASRSSVTGHACPALVWISIAPRRFYHHDTHDKLGHQSEGHGKGKGKM